MEDYAGNTKKEREGAKSKKQEPEKKIEQVVTSEVILARKPLGRKVKDLFIEADLRSVVRYVTFEVFIPAARNMIVDMSTKGIERMMYGESNPRRFRPFGGAPFNITSGQSRYSYQPYNTPVNRGEWREPATRPPSPAPQREPRAGRNEFIIQNQDEAEAVLDQMIEIIDTYTYVSVADLNELIGWNSSHVDNKWGWFSLAGAQVRQVHEGYLLDLPQPEPLQ